MGSKLSRRGIVVAAITLAAGIATIGPLTGAEAQQERPSRAEVTSYVANARAKGPHDFDQQELVSARVTFSHPLTYGQFVSLMQRSGAQIGTYRIRVTEEDGTRAIIGGAPERDGTLLDPRHLAALAQQAADRSGKAIRVHGVFDVNLMLNRAGYEFLNTQDDVYLVETERGTLDGGLYHLMEDNGLTTE